MSGYFLAGKIQLNPDSSFSRKGNQHQLTQQNGLRKRQKKASVDLLSTKPLLFFVTKGIDFTVDKIKNEDKQKGEKKWNLNLFTQK